MDLNETGSLKTVENLLDEFFSPCTSNARKHEIEVQLSAIKAVPQSGKLCLYFIAHTSSHYVTMFALQTLESVINQQWLKTDWTLREEIKSVLQCNLVFKSGAIPSFLRNKYAKLLIDITKTDWLNQCPSLINTILELLKSEESNKLIGLLLLKTIFEDFVSTNSTIEDFNRKKDLSRLFDNYIPIIFDLLTNILETVSTKSRHLATATPPPSPTHHVVNQPPPVPQICHTEHRPDMKVLCQEALGTIELLFSWYSVEQIPEKLIRAIFNFMNFSTYSQDDDDLCISAISTINEIFYKKRYPPGTEAFFRDICGHLAELMRNLSMPSNSDDLFVQKLGELLTLFFEYHFWRLDMDPSFDSIEFLSRFFQYTMHLTSVSCFLRCLSAWSEFCKRIKPNNNSKYSDVFLGLGSALIKKIQFNCNFQQLVEVNNDSADEEGKTEWQHFLQASVEIISQAAQFAPLDIFNQILNSWNLYHMELIKIETYSEAWYNNSDTTETEKLAYILRDFASLTYTLASLTHHFYLNENEENSITATPVIYNLLENTLKSASSYKKIKSYIFSFNNEKLTKNFIDVQSELLASLKTWLGWMEVRNRHCADVEVFLKLLLPLLVDGDKTPLEISSSAAQLFLELAKIPNNLCPLRYSDVAYFIKELPRILFASLAICNTINSSICEILFKNLKVLDQESLQQYRTIINIYFVELTRDFRELMPESAEATVRVTITQTLPVLSHIIEYCRGFQVICKQELTYSLKATLDHALLLFPVYVKYPEVHALFSTFFISVLKNLQTHIGSEYTKNAMHVFLQVAISQQQSNSLLGVQQLLDIFCIVTWDLTNKNFLPEILQLCMENIYPFLLPQAGDHPDVFLTLLELLYSILNYHWSYFYNSQVMMGYSPGGSNNNEVGPDVPKRPEQLLAVLKVFGEALLVEDINIFRQSLSMLQGLNQNKKLYHKGVFRSNLLPELLRILLNTLFYRRQLLTNDDIIYAIYHMAQVDFDGFYSNFLPHYVRTLEGVSRADIEMIMGHFNATNDRDVPSFIQSLQQFAMNFHHLRMRNAM